MLRKVKLIEGGSDSHANVETATIAAQVANAAPVALAVHLVDCIKTVPIDQACG